MSGSTINAIQDKSNNTAIVKIKVLAKPESSSSYKIKSILAGPKGQKLDFISNVQKLYLNNKLVNISFNE